MSLGNAQTQSRGRTDPAIARIGGCTLGTIVRLVPGIRESAIIFRSSTASLVASPLDAAKFTVPACPVQSKFIQRDFGKTFAPELFRADWNVLAIDFIRDLVTCPVAVDGTFVTDINLMMIGEKVMLEDILNVPFERITYEDPRFRALWTISVTALYDRYIRPALDAGRRVVMLELYPARGEFRPDEPDLVPFPAEASKFYLSLLRYMYDTFAGLDQRIQRLNVEDDYWLTDYEVKFGADLLVHKIDDFNFRAAEILAGLIGLPPAQTAAGLGARRLELSKDRLRKRTQDRIDAATQIKALQDEVLQQTIKVANLEDAERALVIARDEARVTASSAIQTLSDERAKHAGDLESIAMLQAEKTRLAAHIESLESDLSSARDEKAAHGRALADANHRLHLEQQRADQLESDLRQARTEIARTAALQSELAGAQQSLTEARSALAERDGDAAAFRIERDGIAAQLQALVQRHAEVESDLRAAHGALAARETLFAETQSALQAELSGAASAREAEQERHAAALNELGAVAETLRQRLAAVAERHSADLAEGEAALSAYRAEQARLAERLNEASFTLSRLQSERDSLRETIAGIESSATWRLTRTVRSWFAAVGHRAPRTR